MRGAGGTNGGIGQFLIGLIMMCGGFYMFLNAIIVTSNFGLGYRLYGFTFWGHMLAVTSGMILIPFIFGIGMIFYNGKSMGGWVLAVGSISALIFGVIASLNFSFRPMNAFDLIVIVSLCAGGLGLFLKSLTDNG